MIEESKIRDIVEEYLRGSSFFVVEIAVDKNNSIVVEVDSDESVPLDYCVELSKYIESKLDRDVEDFDLEVGSAGLTSPFKVLRKYEGSEVEVQVKNGPKYVGVLVNVSDSSFGLEVTKMVKKEGEKKKVAETETLTFTYEQIKYTKYSITFK